jgi:hypothetical protein
MYIETTILIKILFAHWVADFIFQAEVWANNKSKSFKALLKHTVTYSVVLTVYLMIMTVDFDLSKALLLLLITFVCHTFTDYFTSKVVSKMFANKHYGEPIPNFGAFTVIGFDQLLHYLQLFLTYIFIYG